MSGDAQFRATLIEQFFKHVPHNRALGLVFDRIEDGRTCIRLPYRPELVGNPLTGVLHGGVITTVLDACCGAAVFVKLQKPTRIATLDLRIDYLKPALPPHDVVADAQCYKITKHIAFVRSVAYTSSPDDPLAAAVGTFMIIGSGPDRSGSQPGARHS